MPFRQWSMLMDACIGRRPGSGWKVIFLLAAGVALLRYVILPIGVALHLLHPPPGWHP
jgi:hypothetical protein